MNGDDFTTIDTSTLDSSSGTDWGAILTAGLAATPGIIAATTGKYIVPTNATSAQISALQQQALLNTNPTLSGLLSNPTVLVLGVVIIGVVLWAMFRKGG